jgi:eukaryotic-like serine/threonine-protein kinase
MTPEKWQQVKDILAGALALAPEERPAFLNAECGTDEELRAEVEVFLGFEDQEDAFLKHPVFDVELLSSGENESIQFIGKRIGNYKIIREIGVGGMGAVFLAERVDSEFAHRVAIKLIKGSFTSRETIRRFQQERQILASLEHSFIARLIDGGTTDDGIPYFIMEYIEGMTVIEYADLHGLDLEARLNLFRQICQAVEYAHRNLIVHRDLKPSNILVTEDNTPKLLDFGIAKLIKDSSQAETNTRQFAFTPEYASPEQVRGEKLTTATDIYSLGVILFELLTGHRPYKTDSRNIGSVLKVICESEPARPSSVVGGAKRWSGNGNSTAKNKGQRTKDEDPKTNPKSKIQNPKSLRGDLDNIILKALRKEPERRYSSVEQLSEDLRRYQEGLPVSASRDSFGYRFSKFIQRNTLAVGAGALILLTLLGGLAATIY